MRLGISEELQSLAHMGEVVICGAPGAWFVSARLGDDAALLSPYNGPRRPRVFKTLDAAFAAAHRVAHEANGAGRISLRLGAPA